MRSAPFRFDQAKHLYIDIGTGAILPHITGMLKHAGLVDDTWFTEESSLRGQAVHKLTADYDLGSIEDVPSVVGRYKPYLEAHAKAMSILQAEVLTVEEPLVHPGPRPWGGRPDRSIRLASRRLGVLEVKTTIGPHRSHEIQTALQAILVAACSPPGLPPEEYVRLALYLKPTGKFKVLEHTRAHDFTEARKIIREVC